MTNEDFEAAKEKVRKEDLSKFPSIFQEARNLAKQTWLSAKTVWEGGGLLIDAEKAKERLDMCMACEYYKDSRCLKCGCFMNAKVNLVAASCPVGKWGNPQVVTQQFSGTNIDINTIPVESRAELLKVAEEALVYDGRFAFHGKQYLARKTPTGQITLHAVFPRQNMQYYTEKEQEEFNKMVEANKGTDGNTFMFKGVQFSIKLNPDGRVLVLAKPKENQTQPPSPSTTQVTRVKLQL